MNGSQLAEIRAAIDSASRAMLMAHIDWSGKERLAWVYGILIGWSDETLVRLQREFEWSESMVMRLRRLHSAIEDLDMG